MYLYAMEDEVMLGLEHGYITKARKPYYEIGKISLKVVGKKLRGILELWLALGLPRGTAQPLEPTSNGDCYFR